MGKIDTALIIIWQDGTAEKYIYPTYEDAQKAEAGYKMAFGNQIEWSGLTTWRGYTS